MPNDRRSLRFALSVIIITVTAFVAVSGVTPSALAQRHSRSAGHSQTTRSTRSTRPDAQSVRVFNHACGRCHPNGSEDTGPDLHGKRLTEARAIEVIRHGTGDMRPISTTRLRDEDLPRVISYLRSIRAVR